MTDRITVLISTDPTGQQERKTLEQAVIRQLERRPEVRLIVSAHLYDLSPDGPGVQYLRSIASDMIVLSWLYPRAAFWTLDVAGIRGRIGIPSSEEPDSSGEPDEATNRADDAEIPDRTIWCLDLREYDGPEPLLEEIGRIAVEVTASTDDAPISADAEREELEETPASRWYPVIDYGRCTNCLECLNFCLFGVYSLDSSDTIFIEQPDACRAGCPACSRICPAGAIMFPQHQDPGISGDPKASLEGLKLDLSQLFAGVSAAELAAVERDRALAAYGEGAESSTQTTNQQTSKDDLDRLVDELDEFDL